MKNWSLKHLEDHALLCALTGLVTRDRATTAAVLAHIVETEERRLYLHEACSSMFDYCKRVLHMSEGTTYKRIQAARTARRFPAIFDAVADGRLHLSAVVVLAPHLKLSNAEALLAAAAHKTRAEVEAMVAAHFPKPDLPTAVRALPPAPSPICAPSCPSPRAQAASGLQLSPGTVVPSDSAESLVRMEPLRGTVVPVVESRARLVPLSPGRYAVQATVDQETYDLLREAKALLGHSVPSGDVAEVLKRALGLLVQKLKAQKFGRTAHPRPQQVEPKGRNIPAAVQRIVSERDHEQCTFVSAGGRRCEARTRLEYDHVRPIACGGKTTVANLRLLCRQHNQHMARVAYGAAHVRERQAASLREAARPRAR